MKKIKLYNPNDETDYYTITIYDNGPHPIWIRYLDGEGMGMTPEEAFNYLDKWFRENM